MLRSVASRLVFIVVGIVSATGCASTPRVATPTLPPLETFCTDVQHYMAQTTLPVKNVVHTDYDAFVLSKAQIRPLQTEQLGWYEDEAKTKLRMISCKMKTADHLRAEYGADAAGGEEFCSGYNRRTLAAVLAQIPASERASLRFDGGRNVVIDPDENTTMGPTWLEPYRMAYIEGGLLHIKSKAMRNDWLDQRYANSPVRFRGTRYCHLVAPEYLRRLLRGETEGDAK